MIKKECMDELVKVGAAKPDVEVLKRQNKAKKILGPVREQLKELDATMERVKDAYAKLTEDEQNEVQCWLETMGIETNKYGDKGLYFSMVLAGFSRELREGQVKDND